MERITSRRNPTVSRMRRLAIERNADDAGLLLDGDHLVGEALRARIRLLHVLADETRLDGAHPALLREAEAAGARIAVAPRAILDAASPVRSSSGLVAIGEAPDVPREAVLRPDPALIVLAMDVQDPGNLGSMIRAAAAAAATGVMTAGASADPFGWKSLRGSMGSAFRVPIVRERDPLALIAWLHDHGVVIVATAPRAPTRFWDADLRRPLALLLGSEGHGLPPVMRELADETVSIPMAAGVESLNVAAATTVIAYEARRQRTV
jgi:RNA methyltransferase, TrmH family